MLDPFKYAKDKMFSFQSSSRLLFFWDAYETQEQVMNHLMNEAIVGTVDKKLIDQLLQELPNGWDNRVIWEFVTRTN